MELLISFLSDWGYIALFICMALENMNIPIPSEIILGFAGFLVSQQIFSFWPTIIIGTAAGIAGSLLSYYMGLKGGREFMLRHTAKGGLGAKKLIAAKTGLKHMEVSLFLQAAFFRVSALLSPFPQASHIILSPSLLLTRLSAQSRGRYSLYIQEKYSEKTGCFFLNTK